MLNLVSKHNSKISNPCTRTFCSYPLPLLVAMHRRQRSFHYKRNKGFKYKVLACMCYLTCRYAHDNVTNDHRLSILRLQVIISRLLRKSNSPSTHHHLFVKATKRLVKVLPWHVSNLPRQHTATYTCPMTPRHSRSVCTREVDSMVSWSSCWIQRAPNVSRNWFFSGRVCHG